LGCVPGVKNAGERGFIMKRRVPIERVQLRENWGGFFPNPPAECPMKHCFVFVNGKTWIDMAICYMNCGGRGKRGFCMPNKRYRRESKRGRN